MKNFLKVLCLFLGIKVKEKEDLNPGVLGYYDCKPYHNFHFALNYARNIEVFNDGKIEAIKNMIKLNVPKDKILECYSEAEYNLAVDNIND